jgi:nucleoside-diphosphate-sugar epimerase
MVARRHQLRQFLWRSQLNRIAARFADSARRATLIARTAVTSRLFLRRRCRRRHALLLEQLATRPELRGEAFNFSNELRISVLELVQKLLAVMGSNLEPDVRNEASNEIKSQYLDATKARTLLNWSPSFSLETGLLSTIEWYRRYFSIASRA